MSRHPGDFLRSHHSAKWGDKNRKQHAAFLAEVEDKPALHAEIIDWFLTLPLWLDLPDLHVVHACWHPPFMAWLAPYLRDGRYLTQRLDGPRDGRAEDEAEKDNATPSVFKAVECLTKGIEIPLPAGHQFQDKDGHIRSRVRVRWWDEAATTYRTAAMLSPAECAALPDLPIPAHARVATTDDKPVFFGHYWLTGTQGLQSSRCVCVDYSAGNRRPPGGVPFRRATGLSLEQFVWVD